MRKPIPYTDETDSRWSDIAVETFEVRPAPDEQDPVALDLSGPCPRCTDHIDHTHWLIAFSGVASMTREEALHAVTALRDTGVGGDSLLPAEFSVRCSCDVPHPDPLGRKVTGCGAMWRMRFEAFDEHDVPFEAFDEDDV